MRELLVIVTEDLLDRYNQDNEIRPNLKNYPFTTENLWIGITVVDPNGIGIHNPGNSREYLYAIYQFGGRVEYDIKNDEKLALQTVFKETYEEALNIVKNQKKTIL